MITGISKLTRLELIIKNLMKETRLCLRAAYNMVRRGHNIRGKISRMEKFTLMSMRGG